MKRMTIHDVTEIEAEIHDVQDNLTMLTKENFDVQLEINHLENILAKIVDLHAAHPKHLLDVSNHFQQILDSGPIESVEILQNDRQSLERSQANIVKSHTVNGHEFRPTITVPTIVDDSNLLIVNEINHDALSIEAKSTTSEALLTVIHEEDENSDSLSNHSSASSASVKRLKSNLDQLPSVDRTAIEDQRSSDNNTGGNVKSLFRSETNINSRKRKLKNK